MSDPAAEPKTERDHHRRAFEIYSSLAKRSYREVARQLGLSVRTIKGYSRTFGWQERIQEREASLARRIADQSLTDGLVENERNLKLVRAALLRIAKGITEGKIKMQMGDLERMIKLEEHLTGRPATAEGGPSGTGRPGVVLILPPNGRDEDYPNG